jgi:hypothetical protein
MNENGALQHRLREQILVPPAAEGFGKIIESGRAGICTITLSHRDRECARTRVALAADADAALIGCASRSSAEEKNALMNRARVFEEPAAMAAEIREADAQNGTLERRGSATPMKRRCNVNAASMRQPCNNGA